MSDKLKKPSFNSVTSLYIFIMLLIFPLFTGISGYANITLSKFLFFVIATSLWLLALFCLAVRDFIQKKLVLKKPRPVQIFVLLFMLIACLSAALSPYGSKTIIGAARYNGLLTLLLCGAIFLGISAFGRLRRLHIAAFCVSVSICCAVSVLQLFGLNALWLFPDGLSYYDAFTKYSGEFLGTIGNTNLLSALLCLSIPLFAAYYIIEGETISGWLWVALIFAASFSMFILVYSGVAGGLVATAACVILCAPLIIKNAEYLMRALFVASALVFASAFSLTCRFTYLGAGAVLTLLPGRAATALFIISAVFLVLGLIIERKKPSISEKHLRRALLCLSSAFIAIILLVLWFYPGNSGTAYELSRVMHGDIRDGFGSSRVQIWRGVLALVPEHPLFGGGPGTLSLRLDINWSRYVPETGKTLSTFVDNAHNDYLGYLADIGFLGLGALLAAIICSTVKFIRQKSILPAVFCAVLCYFIQSNFGLGLCVVSPLMWLFWGLFESVRQNIKTNYQGEIL